MKIIGITLIVLFGANLLFLGGTFIYSEYIWNRDFESLWSLSDKSSTVEQKANYIDQFYKKLRSANLASNDAIWMTTPNNSRSGNLLALKSLRDRLQAIKGMNPNSFEYQQAIYQITQQEQGEAHQMISTLNGCWKLANFPYAWCWIAFLNLVISISVICFGGWLIEEAYY